MPEWFYSHVNYQQLTRLMLLSSAFIICQTLTHFYTSRHTYQHQDELVISLGLYVCVLLYTNYDIVLILYNTSIGTRSAFFSMKAAELVPKPYSKESMSSGTF